MRYSLANVLRLSTNNEGGYSNHPKDPGGPTNHGITQATLSAYIKRPASVAEVKALTLTVANDIYVRNYWAPIWGDKLPAGLDYAVFDFGINSGPSRAIKELQACLKDVAVDGVMGAKTLAAIEAQDNEELIKAYIARRMAFFKRLKTWGTFGRGWQYRTLGIDPKGQYKRKPGVLGDALKMATQRPVTLFNPIDDILMPLAKARDVDTKLLAPLGNKLQGGAIATAGTAMLTNAAADYLPSFTSALGMLEPYKDTAKAIGFVFTGLVIAIAAMTMINNISKARESGTNA